MKIEDLKKHVIKELSLNYDKPEADSLFYMLMHHFFGYSKIDVHMNSKEAVHTHLLFDALDRLMKNEPIQHITGEVYFCNLKLKVNENTLIPRPETEELISLIRENSSTLQPLRILDIGTGTGCIALALKKLYPEAEVVGIDISVKALEVAQFNAEQNQLSVEFLQMDFLNEEQPFNSTFDLIVSNPPYIRMLEREAMHENVLKNEPHQALFVSDERPLVFYESICSFANENLSREGNLFLEINQHLGEETSNVFSGKGFMARLYKDFYGNNRFVRAWK